MGLAVMVQQTADRDFTGTVKAEDTGVLATTQIAPDSYMHSLIFNF